METVKQTEMTKKNNKEAQELDSQGFSDYYFIQLRSKAEFKHFRFYDVGAPGHVLRLEGLGNNGTSYNLGWLISKRDAHIENHFLKADSKQAQEVLTIHGPAYQIKDDVFI